MSEPPGINRRSALQSAIASGICLATTHPKMMTHSAPPASKAIGISEIRLHTAKLAALEKFYRDDLGLTVRRESAKLTVHAGTTRIIFDEVESNEPFYHVAFNIPENKLEGARRWQKQRTPLLKRGQNEVIHFSNWNAHSVFFHDPAGNILEYIARHDLPNAAEGEFTPADILYASEIGLVVDDVPATVALVQRELGLGVYKNQSRYFAPLGDEHALLILVQRKRLWTPDKKREAEVHPLTATIRSLKNRELKLPDYGYRVATSHLQEN